MSLPNGPNIPELIMIHMLLPSQGVEPGPSLLGERTAVAQEERLPRFLLVLVVRLVDDRPVAERQLAAPIEQGRFAPERDLSWVNLSPELLCEPARVLFIVEVDKGLLSV